MCLLWCWLKKPVAFCYMEMLGRSRVSPSLDSSSSSVLVFLKRKNSNGAPLQAKKAELDFNKQRSKNIFGVWVSWIKQQLPDPDRHRAYIPQLPVITSLVTSSTSTMDTGRKGACSSQKPILPRIQSVLSRHRRWENVYGGLRTSKVKKFTRGKGNGILGMVPCWEVPETDSNWRLPPPTVLCLLFFKFWAVSA